MSAQDEANQAAKEFACNSAAQLALLANPTASELIIDGVPTFPPPGDPVFTPDTIPGYQSPPGTRLFYNRPQICSVECPDHSLFTFTCPPGRFSGASQAQADAIARSYACQQAALRKVCPPATPCTITDTSPLSPFDQGQPYSHQFTASGGIPPLSWSIIAGSLPAGLSMNGNGLLSGTAALVNGNLDTSFTVRAVDSASPANVCTKVFSLPVLDYHDFPPGKHWRVAGFWDGLISSACCGGPVNPAVNWNGQFDLQVGPANFNSLLKNAPGEVLIDAGRAVHVFLTPHPAYNGEWSLTLSCSNPAFSWAGRKLGSNTGAKLDSPAGTYTQDCASLFIICCAPNPTLTIEEY